MESELFGYEVGFPYPDSQGQPGKFERASAGTIFLDSIGDLDLRLQSRLIGAVADRVVERIQGRPPKESGLFVPSEEQPRLHLCRVVSVGPGREEENGSVAPPPDIQPGDVVIAKNPWGIGPKAEETVDNKKLSYMRSQDIAAVIPGGLVEDDEE